MSEEILMNISPMESRVALIENGVLQEILIERVKNRGLVGNIYKGRIVKVMPGMQAAFVDIGIDKAAFIHVGEITEKKLDKDEKEVSISELVHEGQSLIVQVIKDSIGSKGARLTTHVSLPTRYAVFMPGFDHIGISLRIEKQTERDRLKEMAESIVKDIGAEDKGGFILRTAADSINSKDLITDIKFLLRLWDSIKSQIESSETPTCIYEDLPLSLRTIRDMASFTTEKIHIDCLQTYQKIEHFVKKLVPHLTGKIELYTGKRALLDLYSIEDEINRALQRKVLLKSGGYLIFDQTESMTTIDVNTGGFIGYRNFADTVFKTNMEASTAIARQLRLRNLGGIIIIDFIDMDDSLHQRQVLRNLEKKMEIDHSKTKISGVSEFGLVEMTRKRTRESLENTMCEACSYCSGRGVIKTAETICSEIFREIIRESLIYDNDTYMVLASESVLDRMLDEESANVVELETMTNKTIRFQVEPNYSQEQFDIVLV